MKVAQCREVAVLPSACLGLICKGYIPLVLCSHH